MCDRSEIVIVTGIGSHSAEIIVKIKSNKDPFVGFLSSLGYRQLHESLFEITKKCYKNVEAILLFSGCANDESSHLSDIKIKIKSN